MNTYVLIAFAAAIVSAQALPQGWSQPPAPIITANLEGDAAAAAAGTAEAYQDMSITADGTSANPAHITSASGTGAGVAQGIDIEQNISADSSGPSLSTSSSVTVENVAAAVDNLDAHVTAGLDLAINNAGTSDASGAGVIIANDNTHAQVVSKSRN